MLTRHSFLGKIQIYIKKQKKSLAGSFPYCFSESAGDKNNTILVTLHDLQFKIILIYPAVYSRGVILNRIAETGI